MYVRRVDPRLSVPRNRVGDVALSAAAIGPEDAMSPFRAGVPWFDELDDVTYRVVVRLNPLDGWASSEFWQRRWGMPHRSVCEMSSAGWLDAAMEEGTAAKRYRCRDEHGLKLSPAWKRASKQGSLMRAAAKQRFKPR